MVQHQKVTKQLVHHRVLTINQTVQEEHFYQYLVIVFKGLINSKGDVDADHSDRHNPKYAA